MTDPVTTRTPPPTTPRPRRPVLVELASAMLIVGGGLNLFTSIDVIAVLGQQQGSGVGGLTIVAVVLAAVTVTLGLLVRYGRAWLLTINVVAIIAFLELISATPVGLLFGGIDTFIVVALMRERWWFATPEVDSDVSEVSP